MLDLGANVDCTPEHLLQFGIMGAMLVSAVEHKERPTVGLLNIGEEEIKGNEVVKQAAELLRASDLNFHGNVEGDDIFKGTTDVVVCDGFVGNVALKTSEGLAQMMGTFLREEFTRNCADHAWPRLSQCRCSNAFKRRVDPRRYNGASLLGLRGIVVKSHGSADRLCVLRCALERAAEEVRSGVLGAYRGRSDGAAAALTAVRSGMIYSRIIGTGSYCPAHRDQCTTSLTRGSTPATSGSSSAPASASATSPPSDELASDLALEASRARSKRPGRRPTTST